MENFANAYSYKPTFMTRLKEFLYGVSYTPNCTYLGNDVLLTDISFYQDTANFDTMKSIVYGTIVRAGQNSWKDPRAETFMVGAEASGLPIGSYWFYDSRETPEKQAQYWKEVLGNHETPLMCWADYEENYGGQYSGWTKFYDFLEACKRLMPNRKFGIYTGYYYWIDHSPNPITQSSSLNYFGQYPLWLASYNPISYVKIPRPWTKFTLWQYTDKGDGVAAGVGSLNVDMNKFNGTPEEFKTFFGLANGGNVDKPILYEGVLTWPDGANLRLVPTVISNVPVGRMYNGEPFQAIAKHIAIPGVEEWFQLVNGYWFAYLYGGQARTTHHEVNPPATSISPTEITVKLSDGSIWKATSFTKVE